jgi:uncharacterized protein (DUF58 family)
MVQEFHQSRDQGLIVLLELWQPKHPSEADVERVELAVSFTATICMDHLRQTRGVEQVLSICGRESTNLRYTTIGQAVESLLDTLALVEGGSADGLAKTVEEVSRSMNSLMRCVLVTTRQHDAEITSQLGENSLPNLEVIHASQAELAQWFSLNHSTIPDQLDQESASTASSEVAEL